MRSLPVLSDLGEVWAIRCTAEQQRGEAESGHPKAAQNTPQDLDLCVGAAEPSIPTPVTTWAPSMTLAASVLASALLRAS